MAQRPAVAWPLPVSLGRLIALLGLILTVVFAAIGRIDMTTGLLLALSFLSQLIP